MGKIFSINRSAVKGVPKEQARTAALVKNHGIKDDAHAGTPVRQVSLLAMESVRGQIAAAKARNAAVRIRPGIYAENITTEGIDLAALKLGDKIRVGKTAVLRISKIGKECHKRCAIYHQTGDCIMPREGIFGEVLESGEIAVGDVVESLKDEERNGRPYKYRSLNLQRPLFAGRSRRRKR
ncbi:MAG: MOSC domain-containing protein [Elusimicrobia bacterium]|nr:MOSC domain-containing protein [Elusimicrobiota bacterium]